MHFAFALNAYFGSALVIILIFADYIRKYNTDSFQRAIFVRLLIFVFIPVFADFLNYTFEKIPGEHITFVLYLVNFVYYAFSFLSYCYVVVFVDYSAYKDSRRTKRILTVSWILFFIFIIVTAANCRWHFFFEITADNIYVHGPQFYVRVLIGYVVGLFGILDMAFFSKHFKKQQFIMFCLFLIFSLAGSIIDGLLRTSIMFYVFYSVAMLYAYFFIIRTDSNIDTLTGIGNRYSINEFFDKLARQKAKEAWAVVMIDMDHFKAINDTLGHLEGDNALKDMVNIIKASIRHSDFAARYGGDEFILATKAVENIGVLIDRIQEAIDSQNKKKIRPYIIEMSYGYDVYFTGQNQPMDEFIKHIDSLMYLQKNERQRRSSDRKE